LIPKPKNLTEAVFYTLAFFDIFERPLNLEEIWRYLFGWTEKDQQKIKEAIEKCERLDGREGYYCLLGREEILKKFEERQGRAKKWWGKTELFLRFLELLPTVKIVGVVNTLAFSSPEEGSDIDLFIVIQKGYMWSTRLFITLLLSLLRVRRHGRKIAGRFCLSFFVTEDFLNLEELQKPPYDIYLVYWLVTLKPVFDRGLYKKFVQENAWIQVYLPRPLLFFEEKVMLKSSKILDFFSLFFWIFINSFTEKIFRYFLKKRSEKKARQLDEKASVIISDQVLKFHNVDRRDFFRREWEKRIG